MRVEYVIYMSSSGCSVHRRRGHGFEECEIRVGPGGDTVPLVQQLSRLPAGIIAVAVDMVDEEHVRDVVPRLGRRDQQAVLARKLARTWPRTPLRTAQVQDRNPANPGEQRVLLSALTKPELVRNLKNQLQVARLPVLGAFSPAHLGRALLDKDAAAAPALMLVTRQRDGSLRHSFFREGQLAGSRLLRQAAGGSADNPLRALRQLEESLRYFDPAFMVSATNPLRVLMPAAELRALDGTGLPDGWRFDVLDLAGACSRLRLRRPVGEDEADLLWVELVARNGGAGNFAPEADRTYFDLFRLRSVARVACLAIAMAGFGGAANNSLYIAAGRDRRSADASTVEQLQRLLPVVNDMATAGVDPLEMQQVVSAFDALASRQVDPEVILAVIGGAASANPRIHLEAIQWQAADAPAGDTGAPADGESADAAAESPAVDPAEGVTVTLRGRIRPFDGDYPRAFGDLDAFMESLREDPAVVAVRSLAQPLDVRSSSTLSGELARGRVDAEAPFAVQVTLRSGHETA